MDIEETTAFKDVAKICRLSYVTIWRIARLRGQLTHIKRLGPLRVDTEEVRAELRRNLIVAPGGVLPEIVFKPGLWVTMGEAAGLLKVHYDQVRRHRKEFTRTRFFGKILLYKNDLVKPYKQEEMSQAYSDRIKVSEGLRI